MTDIPMDFFLEMDYHRLDMIAKAATDRVVFASELKNSMSYLYTTPNLDKEFKLKNVEEFQKVASSFSTVDMHRFESGLEWTSEEIKFLLNRKAEIFNMKVGKIMPLLRVALTGGEPGPQLPDVMYIIGPEETKKRITSLLDKLKEMV